MDYVRNGSRRRSLRSAERGVQQTGAKDWGESEGVGEGESGTDAVEGRLLSRQMGRKERCAAEARGIARSNATVDGRAVKR